MPTIITLPVEISPELIRRAAQGQVRRWVGPENAEAVVRAVLSDVLGEESTANNRPARPDLPAHLSHVDRARVVFADDLAAGQVPSLRRIQRRLRVGQQRAQRVQAELRRRASCECSQAHAERCRAMPRPGGV